MSFNFPPRLELANSPTPLEFAPRLTELFGGPEIWIKRDDLTGSVLSGNKVRKIEFSLAEAKDQGATVIITAGAIQSNHCRATAIACAKLGLKCHLVLRGSYQDNPDGNLFLDYLSGAKITFNDVSKFDSADFVQQLENIRQELTAEYEAAGEKVYFIPIGASNAVGSWGYAHAYVELMNQAVEKGLEFKAIVSATGSGGTMSGLNVGRALTKDDYSFQPDIYGVNVCETEEYFVNVIRTILREMQEKYSTDFKADELDVRILDGYVGEGYAIPYDGELEVIKQAAANEGLVFDTCYTGKGLYGLKQEIAKGRFKAEDKVVFIHTGGMFGNFATKSQFGLPGDK